jgi:hypothetical protein
MNRLEFVSSVNNIQHCFLVGNYSAAMSLAHGLRRFSSIAGEIEEHISEKIIRKSKIDKVFLKDKLADLADQLNNTKF